MFFGYSDDDIPDEIRERMEIDRLRSESYQHELKDFVEKFNEEDLKTFKSIIFQHSDRPSAAYMVGIINARLDKQFGVCHACGKKHDEVTVESVLGNSTGPEVHVEERTSNFPDAPEAVKKMSGPELQEFIPKVIQDKMDEYGLDFIEFEWPKVRCSNCKQEYVSLDDRMLRSPQPDGCPGCVTKTKWG